MTPPADRTLHIELRRGAYRDSVRLMQISQAVNATPGVSAGLVAMATPLNLDLAANMGFSPPPDATANDMLVALAADDDEALRAALARLEAELDAVDARPGAGDATTSVAPRTVGSAVRLLGANLTLVSTPGRYAFVDAMDALDAGSSVMVFSDNVPVAEEIRLKDAATERGLLAMGPDCGTAVVGGVGLGFANVVRPGPVGLVAASGTGAQHMMSLLDAAGVGVSHVLGVGGRDLSAAVAGRATLAALDALDADDTTELIVVISKPPAPEVAARVREHADRLATPVVFALLDAGQPDLTEVAAGVLRRIGAPVPAPWPAWLPAASPVATGRGAPRAVLRRHAVRRGDAHRQRRARAGALQHPAASRLGAAGRPACGRPSDDRLRRRHADPGPSTPDDRQRAAPGAARRRGRRPGVRSRADRRRARPRRASGPGRGAGPGDRRGGRSRSSSRWSAPPATRRAWRGRPARCATPAPPSSPPTPTRRAGDPLVAAGSCTTVAGPLPSDVPRPHVNSESRHG